MISDYYMDKRKMQLNMMIHTYLDKESVNRTGEPLTSGIDTGLIAMFLKMTPEERLQSNDNAINAIAELRNAADRTQKKNR